MKLVLAALALAGSFSIATAQPAPPQPGPAPTATPTPPIAPTPPPPGPPTPPTPPAPPPIEAFLQQRVVEELAADGLVLSRLGVSLQVEQIGDKLLVSLVDLATGRAAASTKLDALPADREAAVASVIPVVANLAAQLQTPPPPMPPPSPQVDAAERDARARAEMAFQEQAIGFGDEIVFYGNKYGVSTVRNWTAHRGPLREPLSPTAFYRSVGRPDLAEQYDARGSHAVTAFIGATVLTGVSLALFIRAGQLDNCHDYTFDQIDDCADEDKALDQCMIGGLVTLGAAFVTAGIGGYYAVRQHPITEGEAKRLAAEHNRALRIRLGLPVSSGPARARVEMGVAPYVTASGGGLALGGRF